MLRATRVHESPRERETAEIVELGNDALTRSGSGKIVEATPITNELDDLNSSAEFNRRADPRIAHAGKTWPDEIRLVAVLLYRDAIGFALQFSEAGEGSPWAAIVSGVGRLEGEHLFANLRDRFFRHDHGVVASADARARTRHPEADEEK